MKKGCGTKKMAKGGAVKVSPRKAMAMGKKPAGVKKFAAGGAVMAPQQERKTGLGFIQERPRVPAGVPAYRPISGRAIPNATSMSSVQAAPGNPNTFRPGATQVRGTGTMTQRGMQQAAIQNAKNNAIQNAAQLASMQANRVNLAGPQTVSRFKKGGAVKKGGK